MNLILFANGFPFGNWEPYLETEIQYYEGFDSVHICAMQLRQEHRKTLRPLPSDKFHVCPVPFASLPVYALNAVRALGDKNFYRELSSLLRQHRLTPSRLAWLLFYISRSHYEAGIIRRYLKKNGLLNSTEPTVLYSYRFDYQPYVMLLLKKWLPNSRLIARGHRYDLYEEQRSNGYIPLRTHLMENLDYVVPIAQDGLDYLRERYPAYPKKLKLFRLGTLDHGICPAHLDGTALHLVSCSTVYPVKRVHLIVQALAAITDREICWTHYGEGILLPQLQQLCQQLPSNIHYDLRGYVDNATLMEEYQKTPCHLFLNVSSSEGIPVSIMEAMSFGIPCIATAVGGTTELVEDGKTGVLLDADFVPAQLTEHIDRFAAMSDAEYQRYRQNARSAWQQDFSAEGNYQKFAAFLRQLGENAHGID